MEVTKRDAWSSGGWLGSCTCIGHCQDEDRRRLDFISTSGCRAENPEGHLLLLFIASRTVCDGGDKA